MRENKLLPFIRGLLIVFWCAFALAPIVWLGLTSIKKEYQAMSRPPVLFSNPPTLENYLALFSSSNIHSIGLFSVKFPNSLIASTAGTALVLLLSLLAAYALSRYTFRGRKAFAFGILGMQMLPPIASVIPLFIFFSQIHLLDNLLSLVLVYTVINLPFAVWVMKGFVDAIPVDLEEAGMVDGASRLGSFFRIVVPILLPGMGAAGVITWVSIWGEFALAFFLTSSNAGTLPTLAPQFLSESGVAWAQMAAYSMIVMLPAIVVAIVAQRAFVRGLTLGAVKN